MESKKYEKRGKHKKLKIAWINAKLSKKENNRFSWKKKKQFNRKVFFTYHLHSSFINQGQIQQQISKKLVTINSLNFWDELMMEQNSLRLQKIMHTSWKGKKIVKLFFPYQNQARKKSDPNFFRRYYYFSFCI